MNGDFMQVEQNHAARFFIPAPSPREALPDTDVVAVSRETWQAYCRQPPSPPIDWIETPDRPPHTEAEWLTWLNNRSGGGSVFLANWVRGDFCVVTRFVGTFVKGELVLYETLAVDIAGPEVSPTFADAPLLMRWHAYYAEEARRNQAEVFAQLEEEEEPKVSAKQGSTAKEVPA
jgi:hypothetical protein